MAMILGWIAVRIMRAVEPGEVNELESRLYAFALIKRKVYVLFIRLCRYILFCLIAGGYWDDVVICGS
jgi:hypothetical protein